jgi:hypothetical protein
LNHDTSSGFGIYKLTGKIQIHHSNWLHHMKRTEDCGLWKCVLDCKPIGKRMQEDAGIRWLHKENSHWNPVFIRHRSSLVFLLFPFSVLNLKQWVFTWVLECESS